MGVSLNFGRMKKSERYRYVLDSLGCDKISVESELHFGSPYELLVAVMLSAQCTDKRINAVTPALFAAFPTVESMASATPEAVLPYIASVSYPNAKSRHLVAMAQAVCRDFGGEIPQTREQLMTLAGVGRKTANVVLAVAFGRQTLAVDTHVYRVSRRLGLVPASCNTPRKVEDELVKNIPGELVASSHFKLLLHGRYVCRSRKPLCTECMLASVCRYYSATTRKMK